MDSPIIIASIVFISIYLVWFVIRLFADLVLVGIACLSALLAYNIQSFYPEILMILTELNLLDIFALPEEPNELAIFKIVGLIIACAVFISIPILPFSSTYRMMFGVEIPIIYCRKTKLQKFIKEEIQRQNQHTQPLSIEVLPEPELGLESGTEPEPELKSETELEPELKSETELEPELKSGTEPEPELKSETELEPEPKSGTEPEPELKSGTELGPEPKPLSK
ncbi:procyclic acidic repetitive family protein [Thiotrichales bacterium HSG1]|nr:procyclic acidic repetitive family protein [Thiotrichales bacterium HSG1]